MTHNGLYMKSCVFWNANFHSILFFINVTNFSTEVDYSNFLYTLLYAVFYGKIPFNTSGFIFNHQIKKVDLHCFDFSFLRLYYVFFLPILSLLYSSTKLFCSSREKHFLEAIICSWLDAID